MSVPGAETVCRLCLQSCTESKPLQGFITYKLMFIIPKIDLDLCHDPRICEKCIANLNTHYNFKSVCLDNNGPNRNFTELQLVAQRRDTLSLLLIDKMKRRQCGLCFTKEKVLSRLENRQNDMLRTMLERCLLDLDKKISTVCSNCMDSLESFYDFINTCMTSEVKIYNYRFDNNLSGQSTINLSNVIKNPSDMHGEGQKASRVNNNHADIEHITIKCNNLTDAPSLCEEDDLVDIETVEDYRYHDVDEGTMSMDEIMAYTSGNVSEMSRTVQEVASLPQKNDDGDVISIDEIEAKASKATSAASDSINGREDENAIVGYDLNDDDGCEDIIESETEYDEPEFVFIDDIDACQHEEQVDVKEEVLKGENNLVIEEGPDRCYIEEYTSENLNMKPENDSPLSKSIKKSELNQKKRKRDHVNAEINIENQIRPFTILKQRLDDVPELLNSSPKPTDEQCLRNVSLDESENPGVAQNGLKADERNESVSNKDRKGFYCSLCSFWTKKEDLLKIHVELQHNTCDAKKYKCRICNNYKTNAEAQLFHHIPVCHRSFLSKHNTPRGLVDGGVVTIVIDE